MLILDLLDIIEDVAGEAAPDAQSRCICLSVQDPHRDWLILKWVKGSEPSSEPRSKISDPHPHPHALGSIRKHFESCSRVLDLWGVASTQA